MINLIKSKHSLIKSIKEKYKKEIKKFSDEIIERHSSKTRIFLEILIPWLLVTTTIQFFLKGEYFWIKFITIPAILLFIIFSQLRLKISAYHQGFKPVKWKEPFLYLLIPGLVIGTGILIFGYYYGSITNKYPYGLLVYITLVGYPIWGIIQQYVLLVFLLPRLNYLIEKPGKLVLIIAVIFSTSHLPNPFLVILTFPVSIIFLFFFLKYRNLYIQGFVHGFIGSIMKFCLPQDWTLKFWIGNLISWNNFINYFF